MSVKAYLECGKIINTHGVAGALKVESWCDSERELASLKRIFFRKDGEYTEKKVVKASVLGKFVLFTLEGINTLDDAALLKNTVIYASRDDLKVKKGRFFISDLLGLDVIDADSGKVYGTLSDVVNYGASDIYTVMTPTGEKMIPAVKEFIINVDVEKGIFVRPIPGMFDGE